MTVILSPENGAALRKGGLFSSRPPATRPGEPLAIVQHSSATSTRLVRATTSASGRLRVPDVGVKGWATTGALLLVAGTAVGVLQPDLPATLATGVAAAGTAALSGNKFLLPRLKQLSANSVRHACPHTSLHSSRIGLAVQQRSRGV